MPQNRAVGYPTVHPPTAQPHLGLAPPQHPWAADHARFSWQETPIDAEKQLEVGNLTAGREDRKSSVIPPLPVLPEHLSTTQQLPNRGVSSDVPVLPSQRSGQFQQPRQVLQQPTQQQTVGPEQQTRQFRPDIPRNFQQVATIQGPTPSYEASQAAYQQVPISQASMQEQAMYHGPYHADQAQLSAHALPMHQEHQRPQSYAQQDSQEEKPLHSEPSQPKPVHVGPDANPLSPQTPHSAISPSTTTTTNMRTLPPLSTTPFPQPASYNNAYTQPSHQSLQGGTWHHSLGSCADPTTCLSSLFCPCITYGRTQHRLALKSAKKDPTNMLGYSSINGSCVAWSLLCGINIALTAIQHTRIRKVYAMDAGSGNVASDCVKSACCCCCVIAQDEKEMRARERAIEKVVSEGYQSPGGMTFISPT